MATPDLLRFYELYRQMYGGAGGPPQPSRSNAETNPKYPEQTYAQPRELPRTSGEYAPAGEVLPSPAGTSKWGQYSAPVVGAPIGLGVPMPVGPLGFGPIGFGRFGGLPIPFGPPKITEIPMPHFPELPIPESVRGALLAGAALAPWAARRQMQGDGGGPNGSTHESRGSSSPQPPLAQPPNGGGSRSIGILGLLAQAARNLQSAPNDGEQRPSEQSDPNARRLMRVPSVVTQPGTPAETETSPSEPPWTFADWLLQAKKAAKAKQSQGSSSGTGRSFGNKNSSGNRSGSGNNGGNNGSGGNGGDGDDFCTKRMYEEKDECSRRWENGEFAHKDHYWGCTRRATARWDDCNRNGGRPSLSEPRKWSLDPDEELYRNPDR